MERKIITSRVFRQKIDKITAYLDVEFGNKSVIDFFGRLNLRLSVLSNFPEQGRRSKLEGMSEVSFSSLITEFSTQFILPGSPLLILLT